MNTNLPETDVVTRARTLRATAQLVLDALMQKPTQGIPIWLINPMEWRMIDWIAGEPEGTYKREPIPTYRKMLVNSGCCMVDQRIPENPLTMGASGYDAGTERTATTGKETVSLDGIDIDSPEAVVEHIEHIVFPRMRSQKEARDRG